MTAAPFWVNMYRRTKYVLEADLHKKELEYGKAHTLQDDCPLIATIISHILGNGEEEFERFINWMAYIFQTRQKTTKAWVLVVYKAQVKVSSTLRYLDHCSDQSMFLCVL